MATIDTGSAGPILERLPNDSDHTFSTPTKKINDGDDLNFFLTSIAYRDIITWLLQLNRPMFPTKDAEGNIQQSSLTSPPRYSEEVQNLRQLIAEFSNLIEKAPPDTGPRRFGNVAFRTWYRLSQETADSLCETHLANILRRYGRDDQERRTALKDELKVYLLGSFGSAQRLDYGTGHELSFVAFLACLWKLGAFEDGEERAIVMGVIQPYLELIRHLVLTYTLEPAGSHGVWGLDDHSFIPYIFGSAQYGPPINPTDTSTPVPTEGSLKPSPSPSKVTDKATVADYKDSNMYFSAIQFIYDVKRGPFWEHSPVLYDISGIKDGWAKINKGMLKMYVAEVLGKFPVVQHFFCGSLFRWERDPEAGIGDVSVHVMQQPAVGKSMDVPAGPALGVGTKAPWARGGSVAAVPAMQASSGVPSTRAPFATAGTSARPPPPSGPGMSRTAAAWASAQTTASGTNMAPTAAPWAKKNGG